MPPIIIYQCFNIRIRSNFEKSYRTFLESARNVRFSIARVQWNFPDVNASFLASSAGARCSAIKFKFEGHCSERACETLSRLVFSTCTAMTIGDSNRL